MTAATGAESWLRLALAAEVGPVLGHRLLRALGDPEAIFAAPRERLLAVPGVGPGRLAKLLDPAALAAARQEAARAAECGVRILRLGDDDYPALLRRLECPPLVLWVRGRLDPVDRLALAIVGPRNPSNYARLMTGALAGPLAAQGLTLVSGLAYGIDAEVHRAAVAAGGRTLAAVGQGLATPIYPQAHAELAREIVQQDRGAIISIFPLATEPAPGLFPARNEIIAGLALGVLVVEASATSGALITARHGLAAGRQVLACPGDATRQAAQGSNRLIADGAALVQNAEDVLAVLAPDLRREMADLGLKEGGLRAQGDSPAMATANTISDGEPKQAPESPTAAPKIGRGADALTDHLTAILAEEPLPLDALLERAAAHGYGYSPVLERLLQLELDGRIRQMPGRLYALVSMRA